MMCIKKDYSVMIQLTDQFDSDDAMVDLRDNIETYIITADVDEVDEWQDPLCHCNLEDE